MSRPDSGNPQSNNNSQRAIARLRFTRRSGNGNPQSSNDSQGAIAQLRNFFMREGFNHPALLAQGCNVGGIKFRFTSDHGYGPMELSIDGSNPITFQGDNRTVICDERQLEESEILNCCDMAMNRFSHFKEHLQNRFRLDENTIKILLQSPFAAEHREILGFMETELLPDKLYNGRMLVDMLIETSKTQIFCLAFLGMCFKNQVLNPDPVLYLMGKKSQNPDLSKDELQKKYSEIKDLTRCGLMACDLGFTAEEAAKFGKYSLFSSKESAKSGKQNFEIIEALNEKLEEKLNAGESPESVRELIRLFGGSMQGRIVALLKKSIDAMGVPCGEEDEKEKSDEEQDKEWETNSEASTSDVPSQSSTPTEVQPVASTSRTRNA